MLAKHLLCGIILCIIVDKSFCLTSNRTKRNAETCGVSTKQTGLIFHGQDFARGTFPWLVALMYFKNPPEFFCGGTLISKTFVITAAHCILKKGSLNQTLPREILAVFGAHDLSNPYENGRTSFSPKQIFIHNDWNPFTNEYDADISLLQFEKDSIIFNSYIKPICLLNSEDEPNIDEGIVNGWGKSENTMESHENIPKMIKVKIQTNEQCFLESYLHVALSSFRTFCARLKNGSGVCLGDSGGGLFFKINKVHHLKGIVSSSLSNENGCDVNKNAVYTNVFKFKDWIRRTTENIMKAFEKVFCSYEQRDSYLLNKAAKHCIIKEKIDGENFVLGPSSDTSCEVFYIRDNKDVKYLPRQIGEILPNLEEVNVQSCGLTIIRDFYFKNMRKLRFLELSDNEIVTIEPNAFKDLVKLEKLWLKYNMIETLDEKLFDSMINLKQIQIQSNEIKFLSPETFKIPGGKLGLVDLVDNICIHQVYNSPEQLNRLESDLRSQCSSNATALSPQDLKKVVCAYAQHDSIYLNRKAQRCFADQKIESEDYFVLKETIHDDVEIFHMPPNKYVKFLPKNVVEKFPNLKEFEVNGCGLKIVRDFYFKNMRNLKFLLLIYNKIAKIEADAFKDLVSVEKLWLHDNLMETLDENLFGSMISLEEIYLNNNKIKFLSSATFKIPGGSLFYVDLQGNACTGKYYRSDNVLNNLNKLESDLRNECSKISLTSYKLADETVSCHFYAIASENDKKKSYGCLINQTIDNESFVLESPVYTSVEKFSADGFKNVKFLPKSIGEKFPNLLEIQANNSGLIIVRKYYLENLRNLQFVRLNDNKIASIESDSFKDLVNVQFLWFRNNEIESLDKDLFMPLVKLDLVDFVNNKIKFLNSNIFNVPGGVLELIDLRENVCINKIYGSKDWGWNNLEQLESDLKFKCNKSPVSLTTYRLE